MEKKLFLLGLVLGLFACILTLPSIARGGIVGLDGLVGYWPMDDGAGTIAADMSIFGNNGELNGDPEWIVGKIGGALDLDGIGDYVACGFSEVLRPESAITIQVWVNIGGYSPYAGIVSNVHDTSSTESGYWLGTYDDAEPFGWAIATSGLDWFWTGPGCSTNTWYHLVASYEEAGFAKLWIDGELAIDGTSFGYMTYDPIPLYGLLIGRYQDDNELYQLDALVDEVAIWNRILSEEEILSLYNDGAGRSILLVDTVPSNNETLVPISQELSWSLKNPMTVAGYDVYFGADPNTANNPKVVDYELVNSHVPSAPLYFDTTYYWHVDVYETDGVTEVFHPGIPLSFTTVPDTPVLNANLPGSVAVDVGADVVFTVEATNPLTNDGTGMTYAWYKAGESGVLSATDTLETLDAQLADEGLYYCTVTITANGKTSDSREAALVIKRQIGHWPLDGNLDDVIGGNDGSYTGTGQEDYGTGQPDLGGSALEFDGIEDNAITVPSTAVLSEFWSVVFWEFSPEGTSGDGSMVASGHTEGWESMYMRRWHDGWIGGIDSYTGAVGETSDGFGYLGPYARGQWHYHVLTNDPTTGTAAWYIDGVKVDEDDTVVFTGFDSLIYIGNRKSGESAFEGLIDDLWLYNYPLEELDIALLYNGITGEEVCIGYSECDFNMDCRVDVADFLIFVEGWLECGRFPAEYCE